MAGTKKKGKPEFQVSCRELRFNVGPWKYSAYVDEDVRGPDGEPADGLTLWSRRELVLCMDLPKEQRLDVLLSLLADAWDQHFGIPTSRAETSRRMATFCADVWSQLESQGGPAALMSLWALGDVIQQPAADFPPLAGEGGGR